MPIINTIDKDKKLIYSKCTGKMTPEDFDLYINNVWSTKEHYDFNELFDTVDADWDDFNFGYLLTVAENAAKLETINPNTKLAWIVLEGKQKELTDFYKAAKSVKPVKSRELEAFYSREEALNWLKK